MKVTNVKIYRREVQEGDTFLGTAQVVLEDCFVIYGIRLFDREGKRYILMPARKLKDNWVDICHPITTDMRNAMEKAVFEAYDKGEEA